MAASRLRALCLGVTPIALAMSASADVVQYRFTFVSTWSAATHPTNFPANPHFSQPVGGTHNANVEFWRPGGIASPGIESMAETGGTATLISEVNTAVAAGTARAPFTSGSVSPSPGTSIKTFSTSTAFPLITVVSMVAPSPDWFVGVNSLPLFDEYDGWVDEVVIDLDPWDAGSDSGISYNSPDADLDPQIPINNLTDSFPFNSGGYLGTFTFARISEPCPADLDSDGAVDIDDLSIMLANFGENTGSAKLTEGDLNADRAVDIVDLSLLLSQFGGTCQ